MISASLLILIISIASSVAFTSGPYILLRHRNPLNLLSPALYSQSTQEHSSEGEKVIGVVAPLKYVGPYACLELVFPHLSTKTQEGASLTFVLDTGATVVCISKDVAKQLNLPVVIKKEDLPILGSAGAGGTFQAGDFVLLGDCQLGGMPADQKNITFMRNLTAAALDLGTVPVTGLLGSFFFASFSGVEFDWIGTDGDPPTCVFYYSDPLPDDATKSCVRIPLEDSFMGVPAITVNINGRDLRAILDTGSPISIISPSVAEEIGLEQKQSKPEDGPKVQIKGIDEGILNLSRSSNGANVSLGNVSLGNIKSVCVGSLPGLSLVGNMASVQSPEVLLGLDALRRLYRFILTKNEVWIEPMPKTK